MSWLNLDPVGLLPTAGVNEYSLKMAELSVMELFTALAGIATLLLVLVAAWQLRALRQEAKRDRRPLIFVDVSRSHTRAGKEGLYLSFTNYGRTPATNVIAEFSTTDWKLLNNRTLAFERPGGILCLPPGATLTYFIGPASPDLVATYSSEDGVTGFLRYGSSETLGYQMYAEDFEISLLDRFGAKKSE